MFGTFIVTLICLHSLTFANELAEDDHCTVSRSGASGMCKLLPNCPTELAALRSGIMPTSCGYSEGIEVVCCGSGTTKRPETHRLDRISAIKCKEYEEAVFEKSWLLSDIGGRAVEKKTPRCHSSDVPLVVGGNVTNQGEFPHMALIGFVPELSDLQFLCGGSLISDRYVLSAAHCIRTSRLVGPPRLVRLGEHDVRTKDDDASVIDIDVESSIAYPAYLKRQKYHDIGLIRLSRSVQFNSYVRPACLTETYGLETAKAVATGWGKTNFKAGGGEILMKVTLDLYGDDECRQRFHEEPPSKTLMHGIDSQTQMCAGSRDELKDVCQGDSGGPLQIEHPYNTCMYSIIGLSSFGNQCSIAFNNGTAAVYTRVFNYLKWIEETVWPMANSESNRQIN